MKVEYFHKSFLQSLCALLLVGSFVFPLTTHAAVLISKVTVNNITETSAVVSWESSVPGDSWVGYRPEAGGPLLSVASLTSKTQHAIALKGLAPSTTYVYEVNTATIHNDGGFIAGLKFTTKGGTGTVIPAQPTGTLAQDGSTIYFLMAKDKIKVPFTSMAAFTGLGYNLKNVKKLDLSSYARAGNYALSSGTQEHPWGSWLKWKDGTLYYSGVDGLIGVPSMSVFTANGGKPEMIVPLNAADDAVWARNPKLPVLQAGDGRVL